MIDVTNMLYEITEDDRVYNQDQELLDSGILDSLAFIELFARLEDLGLEIYPTRMDRSRLKTAREIEKLIREYEGK